MHIKKLVRSIDTLPDPKVHLEPDSQEFRELVAAKIIEEAIELAQAIIEDSNVLEELGDLNTIIVESAPHLGITQDALREEMAEKAVDRGTFVPFRYIERDVLDDRTWVAIASVDPVEVCGMVETDAGLVTEQATFYDVPASHIDA